MKEFTMIEPYHHNLRINSTNSSFMIGKHDIADGEEVILRSSNPSFAVKVKIFKSDKRDLPLFSEREADEIAGKDSLYLMWLICRQFTVEQLDRGITYIEHSRPSTLPIPRRTERPSRGATAGGCALA
ncbi:hypothetical protein [Bradyrhizobium genosp. A]|uniref:hypothetical protein n=1 Tax=Bradyrhizobium genosp. A TaxID=83626 RepID=UPI003CFBA6F6